MKNRLTKEGVIWVKRTRLLPFQDIQKLTSAIVPATRCGKPTIPSIEYDLIMNVPYKFTQKDVQFKTCLIKNQIEENKDELRKQFF